ncbi:MAG: glycosyltransferase family 2 protein [Phycisphaerales bacterium]|nr:glycosyltransferase family 2 protein [Phycisphaerales bacterium]
MNLDISVIIPLFNEADSLSELSEWIKQVMEQRGFSYEVLFVNDGSTDNSWHVIKEIATKNPNCKGICFQRNYGKSAALNEGFRHATGHVVITLDADLQDSPEEIPALYDFLIKNDLHLVSGWKKKRFDPWTKTLPTKVYNRVTSWFTKIRLHDFNCGIKAYKLEVVKHIEVIGEMHRYIPVIAKWNGFNKIGEKEVKHQPRKYGYSKFGIDRFVNGALDLMTITFVGKFSRRPMHFFGVGGITFFFLGFIDILYLIFVKFTEPGIALYNRISLYAAFFLMTIGTLLFVTGFLCELILRMGVSKSIYNIREKIGY